MEFGRKFIQARERMGMEQKDAADKLNVSPSFLSRVEKDKQKPSINLIINAAELFGVHPGYFFEKKEKVDLESLYTEKNIQFIQDLQVLTKQEIEEKYQTELDNRKLTSKELRGLMAYVRSLRAMEDES